MITWVSSCLQGVLHTVGGYMLYTATTFKLVFDHQPDDIYWCTADIGWITGHSYITYGPLANGASSVLVRASCFKHNVYVMTPGRLQAEGMFLHFLSVGVAVRGPAHVPGRQSYVGDCGQISGDQVLHRSDRHQAPDEVRRRAGAEVSHGLDH